MAQHTDFTARAAQGLANPRLAQSLEVLESSRSLHYRLAFDAVDDPVELKRAAAEVRAHSVRYLRHYLEEFERNVTAAGGHVHWARDAAEAGEMVTAICREQNAQLVTKSKSMVTEEIGLLPVLEQAGIEVVETDLGEYIIQLRNEPPSHITAPALHLELQQVIDAFNASHSIERDAPLETADQLLAEARAVLRSKFLNADVGITGANFLVADTGGAVVVTNEGNADLTAILPATHIVVTGIEKVVPTLEDAGKLLRVLPRAAVGQRLTNYTSFFHGPRRAGDADGPAEFHVVLLDNGRSELAGGDFEEMLRCIRCGACINHCPVYTTIGGHAYGSVYPGPMGAVLTPQFAGLAASRDLPHASTFCGRCEEVCPVGIRLPQLLRRWRERDHESRGAPLSERLLMRLWAWLGRHPLCYGLVQTGAAAVLRWLARRQSRDGFLRSVSFIRGGWFAEHDLPVPASRNFQSAWRAARHGSRS